MGAYLSKDHLGVEKYFFPGLWKENYPSDRTESPYDPMIGFPDGRKQREMLTTPEEIYSAKLKPEYRDYCAHKHIEYMACLKNTRPYYWNCRTARHELGDCLFEDHVLRMKEWERERRLKEKELKKQKAESA